MIPSFIPQQLHKVVTSKKITAKALQDFDDVTLSRSAWWYMKSGKTILQRAILRFRGLCPLPLKDTVTLFDHQLRIVEFMRQRETTSHPYGIRGGLVLAKMGLGKTLTALVFGCMYRQPGSPTLIVCPKSLLSEWQSSGFEKFFDSNGLRVSYLYSGYPQQDALPECDFVVTTYDVCLGVYRNPDGHTFRDIFNVDFNRVVCDESQRFRNSKRKMFAALMSLQSRFRFCLSGTVIRNTSLDLLSQLTWCGLDITMSETEWTRNISRHLDKLRLAEVMYSVTYEDAGIRLPDKITTVTTVTLSGKCKEVYDLIRGVAETRYDMAEAGKCSFSCVLAAFTFLRQATIAPYLITNESKRKYKAEVSPEIAAVVAGPLGKWLKDRDGEAGVLSPKMKKIVQLIKASPKGDKTVVFSMFNSALDLIAYALTKQGVKYVQIDGSTSSQDRSRILEMFKNTDIDILLVNYKVGSEGINLVEANRIIRVEEWWSDAVHDQATSRAHRIGQTKKVYVNSVIAVGSIEEKIQVVCASKKELASMISGCKHTTKVLNGAITKEIMKDMLKVEVDDEEYW